MSGTRVLVTGSRHWEDEWICSILCSGIWVHERMPFHVYHGGAEGADKIYAEEFSRGYDPELHKVHEFKADWDKHGRAAGPERNERMLRAFLSDLQDGEVYFALAFSDDLSSSKGTADMVNRLKKASVPIYLIGHI